MTSYLDLFAALVAPFRHSEIKKRSQGGRELSYITARTVMNRLDDVLGPEKWWDEYVMSENSVLCRLTIRLPDGSTLTKCDAGGYAGMADYGDDDKSGYSDAFKRAAVKFGVGRHLYQDGLPTFAGTVPGAVIPPAQPATPAANGNGHTKVKGAWGSPGNHAAAAPVAHAPAEAKPEPPARSAAAGPPRTGRAMFAWTKDMEQVHEVALLKYLNNWAKLQEFPARMVEWDADQVNQAYAEAVRKLSTIRGDAYEEALAN